MPTSRPSTPSPRPIPSRRPLRIVNHAGYLAARQTEGELSRFFPPGVLDQWQAPSAPRGRGAAFRYSDTASRTLLAIKASFQRSLSFVVGLVRDHFASRGLRLSVPSESTICVRAQALDTKLWRPVTGRRDVLLWMRTPSPREAAQPIGVLLDSTGLTVRGAGSYRETRPYHTEAERERLRGYRTTLKLHPIVNPVTGQAIGALLAPPGVTDPELGVMAVRETAAAGWSIRSVAADGAYDTGPMYRALTDVACADIRIPPRAGAALWPETQAGATIRNAVWSQTFDKNDVVADAKRAAWKRSVGYHVRSLVESWMSRLWASTGSRCRARSASGRRTEVWAWVRHLNDVAARERPQRYHRAWAAGWPGGAALSPAA